MKIIDQLNKNGNPSTVLLGGIEIPTKFQAGTSNELIVYFHGVIRRDVREFPAFERFLPVTSHQLSIADPALLINNTIVSSWFLGAEESQQVKIITELISDLARELGVKRLILIGGSAGGFAALLYSYLIPGSISISVSPQTRLKTYYSPFAEEFRKSLWPSSVSFDDLEYSDLVNHYAKGSDNFPIILVSARDTGHLYHQIFPFLGSLPFSMRDRFVLEVGFWNVLGHPNSVPRDLYLSWIKAAILTKEISADELCKAHYAQHQNKNAEVLKNLSRLSLSTEDQEMAKLIGNYLIGEDKQS